MIENPQPGMRVRIVHHDVTRQSPYVGMEGTLEFVPSDATWPFVVSPEDSVQARTSENALWPTVFHVDELEAADRQTKLRLPPGLPVEGDRPAPAGRLV